MTIKQSSFLCSAAAAALLAMTTTAGASTLDNNKVLWDSNGNVVHSLAFGNCVRTTWEAGTDVCAPVPVPPQKVVQATPAETQVKRTTLSTAEKTVYFDFDKSTLTPDAQNRLSAVATKLRGADDIKSANIVGYADSIGSNSYNVTLSKKRAEAVKEFLARQGYLNTSVADVRGLGESGTITNCNDSMSRAEKISCKSQDRRVELEVQYVQTQHFSDAQ